jgi:hypothetical protein
MYLCGKIFSVVIKAKSDFQGYEGDIRTMKRGREKGIVLHASINARSPVLKHEGPERAKMPKF